MTLIAIIRVGRVAPCKILLVAKVKNKIPFYRSMFFYNFNPYNLSWSLKTLQQCKLFTCLINTFELDDTRLDQLLISVIPFYFSGKVQGSLKCGSYIMVTVPNTNVYLVVLDGGDCPDSAIKCTSVSNAEEFGFSSLP